MSLQPQSIPPIPRLEVVHQIHAARLCDEPDWNPAEQERKQAQTALQNVSSNSKQVMAYQWAPY